MPKHRANRVRRIALGIVLAGSLLGALPASSSAKTLWLCRPGQKADPCMASLSTSVYTPALEPLRVDHPRRVRTPSIDCFYVYPTVSAETTGTAALQIDPEERLIARYQAARFSQLCRVYAPIYRQVTLAGATGHAKANPKLRFIDVKSALATYLTRYNHHRGFVLIGSDQGAFVLRALTHAYIDPHPRLRRLLVSAILVGANVAVKQGKRIGADFQHIPACRSPAQLACVIAFSTFDERPPSDSRVGRVSASERRRHETALCTNPAALRGGSGRLNPIFPSQPFDSGNLVSRLFASYGLGLPDPRTSWLAQPGAYRAGCVTANHATVLQIATLAGAPIPKPSPSPQWGLHYLDLNLALGNLISIVRREASAYARSHG